MSDQQTMKAYGIALFCAFALLAPTTASAADLNLDIDWSTSPAAAEESSDDTLKGSDWRKYKRRYHKVSLDDGAWQHFLIYHEGDLIAQGYHRSEKPRKPRVGTISDIVSYDNNYHAAEALEATYGAPDFTDVRTKREYSEELGDAAKRARRSVEWDLKGERYRWDTDDGTIRYSVRYSLDGIRDHLLVKVKPGAEKDFHFYQISRAFRKAGIRIIKRFERRSRKMVIAMVTSSGEVVRSEFKTDESELVPVRPEKEQFTSTNCQVQGQDCTLTFRTYGGWVYRVDLDLSSDGRIGRTERGGFDKVGERVYKRFLHVNDRLEDLLGKPQADTSVTNLKDDRKRLKVRRIPQGMEAFWTVWYEPARDMLVRHVITGENNGANWQVDHRVIFRLHSVTRAFADETAWKGEKSVVSEKQKIKARIEKEMEKNRQKEAESDDGDGEASGENDDSENSDD